MNKRLSRPTIPNGDPASIEETPFVEVWRSCLFQAIWGGKVMALPQVEALLSLGTDGGRAIASGETELTAAHTAISDVLTGDAKRKTHILFAESIGTRSPSMENAPNEPGRLTTTNDDLIVPGGQVVIVGLVNRTDLNGCKGVVGRRTSDGNSGHAQYQVTLSLRVWGHPLGKVSRRDLPGPPRAAEIGRASCRERV